MTFLLFYGEVEDRRENSADDHPEQLEPIKERNPPQVGLGSIIERRPESDCKLDDEEQIPPTPSAAFFFCSVHADPKCVSLGRESYARVDTHVEKGLRHRGRTPAAIPRN